MKSTHNILAALQLSGFVTTFPKKIIGGDVIVTCQMQNGSQVDVLFDKNSIAGQFFKEELEHNEKLTHQFENLNIDTEPEIDLDGLALQNRSGSPLSRG
jgi:hypothetical protein